MVYKLLGKFGSQAYVLFKEVHNRAKFSCRGGRLQYYLCPSLLPSEKLNPQEHLKFTMLIQRLE